MLLEKIVSLFPQHYNLIFFIRTWATISCSGFCHVRNFTYKSQLATGQLKSGQEYDFDFDHQFIETEKYDAKTTYKKFLSYSPGVAVINYMIVGIENRDGNTNVRFNQRETSWNSTIVAARNASSMTWTKLLQSYYAEIENPWIWIACHQQDQDLCFQVHLCSSKMD